METTAKTMTGQVALVTGATSGIGRATAIGLAAAGATVLVHGRDAGRADDTVREITASGGRAVPLLGDLVEPDAVTAVAHRALEVADGVVDVLVNNASLFPIGGLTPSTPVADVDAALAVNVRTPFLLVAALAPGMVDRGRGAVVNVLSTVARLGVPGLGLYGATKAALELLTKSWAAEFGPAGVRVNAVSPGPTRTAGTAPTLEFVERIAAQAPAGRIAEPAEIAAAICFLADPRAAFVQGAVLPVDGGRWAV
jgi:NAD(P)-dependent dehydrogenase (short-subunit alcohol dehydrogenase family)